ncbi:ABC transporter substrate-binding protein [Aquicoccus sp. SCR17]|nr:ABC transporter substrate-binding protein [Carideicomes alvinocaridis]
MKRLLSAAILSVATAIAAQAQDDPQTGGTLNLVVQPEPPTVMLGINRLGPVSYVGSKIYEGLVTFAPDMTPLPKLAKSWDISDDGLTYTFHLQEGVKWHDGEPFTSADVVYSFGEYLPEAFSRTRGVMDRVEEISAPDDRTVVFKLKEPYAAFMIIFDSTGGTIVPKHIYEGTDIFKNPANETPIGTGPFKFDEWSKGRYIHLVRNDEYWQDGRPYLDELYFHIIPDANSRAIAFEQGQVDVLRGGDVENIEVNRLGDMEGVDVTTDGWEFYDPLAIINVNTRHEPLDNPKVRQAISYALDREFMIDAVFGGFGKPAYGPMTERTPYYDPEVLTDYSFDMEKAKALMEESGVEAEGGVYATLDLMPLPYGETWQRHGEYIRQQLKEIGIETNVVSVDVAGWVERTTTGKFDITTNFTYLLGDPAMGVGQTYRSNNQLNRGTAANVDGYENPKVDDLFAEGARTLDPGKRQEIYSEAQKIISADAPVIWSHQMEYPTVYRSKIHDLITTAPGLNEGFADVWIEQ